jgi:hypothetical protein
MFSGADAATLGWVRALMWCGFAAATIALAGRGFRTRPEPATAGTHPVLSGEER